MSTAADPVETDGRQRQAAKPAPDCGDDRLRARVADYPERGPDDHLKPQTDVTESDELVPLDLAERGVETAEEVENRPNQSASVAADAGSPSASVQNAVRNATPTTPKAAPRSANQMRLIQSTTA